MTTVINSGREPSSPQHLRAWVMCWELLALWATGIAITIADRGNLLGTVVLTASVIAAPWVAGRWARTRPAPLEATTTRRLENPDDLCEPWACPFPDAAPWPRGTHWSCPHCATRYRMSGRVWPAPWRNWTAPHGRWVLTRDQPTPTPRRTP